MIDVALAIVFSAFFVSLMAICAIVWLKPVTRKTDVGSFENYLSERMEHRFVLEPIYKTEKGIQFEIHSLTSGERYHQFFTIRGNVLSSDIE